jgi:hypothetical protein
VATPAARLRRADPVRADSCAHPGRAPSAARTMSDRRAPGQRPGCGRAPHGHDRRRLRRRPRRPKEATRRSDASWTIDDPSARAHVQVPWTEDRAALQGGRISQRLLLSATASCPYRRCGVHPGWLTSTYPRQARVPCTRDVEGHGRRVVDLSRSPPYSWTSESRRAVVEPSTARSIEQE